MITTEEIKRRLWDGANELRGSMDASRYKDYMLGLMFYKFLSDKTLDIFKTIAQSTETSKNKLVKEYQEAYSLIGKDLENTLKQHLGYFVLPQYLYQVWLQDIDNGEFEVQKVTDSLQNFERTISSTEATADFKGLFSNNSIDLSDSALGSNLKERSENIQSLIKLFADLDMVALQKSDALGDAYEYLIGQFAMEAGKKAGEFYTPRQVSEVMAQIVARHNNISSIYDPTVGSGSLLLTVSRHLNQDSQRNLNYYGQELNTATYNLTRMNLILHGVRPEKMEIRNANTLGDDWPEDPSRPNEGVLFDAVVMNPPYSVKNWNRYDLKPSDPRFEVAGILPPDSKGDYAFLLHGLYHLGQQGTMAIVLPHGVLFRGGSEGEIRKRLLEKNYIDTIIGLPSNLFTNTGIPVVVIILKKNRALQEPVLIIDASKDFIKVGKQNVLLEKDIALIVDTYSKKESIPGYSSLVTREDIIKNDFNMNIPRYVEYIDEEIPHDVDGHLFGGIPKQNIEGLKLLNSLTSDVLDESLETIRPGYQQLKTPINEFKEMVQRHPKVKSISVNLENNINQYIDKYLPQLKDISRFDEITSLKEAMLGDVKEILSTQEFIDEYGGYQIIAELWSNHLNKDLELIVNNDFYELARTREPNLVTKGTGSNKREVQDGWIGTLIPNDLIRTKLFGEAVKELDDLIIQLHDIETELDELIEAAKIEDSLEFDALNGCIRRDKDDEIGNTFVKTELSKALKDAKKGSIEYQLINQALTYINEISTRNKELRERTSHLDEMVQEKILELTNNEIDMLIELKWFGALKSSILDLVTEPLQMEIDVLDLLIRRYSQTIKDIDIEISELESAFELMMKDLVRTNE